ncbi:MAG: CoA transferase [Pseudomonadota bacterium]
MNADEEKAGLLTGIRVLDLGDEKAGFCSRLLADLGAQVIKVERPPGDPAGRHSPFPGKEGEPETSLSFLYHNSNKLGITLNLEQGEGRALFRRLLKGRDVVVETFSSGYLEGLGLGYDRLQKENPGLILVTVSGFGLTGPRRSYKSSDLVASAFGGHMSVTGTPEGPPLSLYGNQSYYAASLFAACAILLALRKRKETGEGRHLDISLQEAVTSTLEHVMIRYFFEKVIPGREGGGYGDHPFFVLSCKDGFIQMPLHQHWETLVELMARDGAAEDLADERWQDQRFRTDHMDHVLEVVERWTGLFTMKDLFELGQAMRFPWAPVQAPEEIIGCPHLAKRGYFTKVERAGGNNPILFPGLPFRFSRPVGRRRTNAPAKGEHNHLIYQDELGLDEREIERLTSIGAV